MGCPIMGGVNIKICNGCDYTMRLGIYVYEYIRIYTKKLRIDINPSYVFNI